MDILMKISTAKLITSPDSHVGKDTDIGEVGFSRVAPEPIAIAARQCDYPLESIEMTAVGNVFGKQGISIGSVDFYKFLTESP